ncbi:MAG: GMC family oxidoreductase N-terminal domain-containing protein [Albidovulum sp.]|nr:GMC family oxidoreductase N-terminal domain-containing protein [Albidovulum sp.]
MATNVYDYIIVGSGSAGCVVANRLSTDRGNRILVLEAGGGDGHFWLKLPVGYFRSIYDKRFSRIFDTVPSESTCNRNIRWPRGRIVGGSSSINGLAYIRGQREDFDDWFENGAEGWSFEEVLPFFKSIENHQFGDGQYHGGLGELPVSDLRNRNAACEAWLRAAVDYGLPFNGDFNGASTYGAGFYQLTIGRRFRASASACFLRPALKRGNVDLLTNAMATRVLFEKGIAIGIEWVADGQVLTARAEREIVLSAGSLQTPQILQLSGVGSPDALRKHRIGVVAEAPDVGENLQDHFQFRMITELNRKLSLNDQVRNPVELAKMGLEWLAFGRGPLTVGAGQVGGGAKTKFAELGRPDVQFNVMPLSMESPGMPLQAFSGFTSAVWQCHPKSRGKISIQSSDPFVQPRIEPNYLTDMRDREILVEGLKMLREIHNRPAFSSIASKELTPGRKVQTDEQLCGEVRCGGGTVFHPVGTCRMGRDNLAVVDSRLRVRGVERLRVIDASVMPKITSANTNAATLMIAEKGASMLIRDSG